MLLTTATKRYEFHTQKRKCSQEGIRGDNEKGAKMVFQREIELRTSKHGDMHNLTDHVERIVVESGVRIGIVHVFCIGSTAAVGAIEFEPGLQRDLRSLRHLPRC